MAWRDNLRDASFRGAAFFVEVSDHEFGRRQEIHEYPLRDKPWAEDLGGAADGWSVEAYVLGDDYMTARDALIKAVKTPGSGTLIHPYYGTKIVICRPGRVREGVSEGGFAAFSLEFVEAGDDQNPGISVDTATVAVETADDLVAQQVEQFPEGFVTAGAPTFVAEAGADLARQAADAAEAAAGTLSGAGDQLYALRRQALSIRDNALALARAPAELAGQVVDLARAVRSLADTPAAALAALRQLMGFGSTLAAVLGGTSARIRQRDNQAQFVRLVRASAAAEAVIAASTITPASYQDAVAVRDDLVERIAAQEEEAAAANDDDSYQALGAARRAIVKDLTARGGSLDRLYDYTLTATTPALVLAYRLHGDALRDEEIVARNGVRHPGFVPAGQVLEVLSDG